MADKGIIFSASMVRALAEGRKTQTRRLINLRGFRGIRQFGRSDTAGYDYHFRRADGCWCELNAAETKARLPVAVGDHLYVREAHAIVGAVDPGWVLYRANGYQEECARHGFDEPYPEESEVRWRPSIHMPRWASRLTLKVENVEVERVAEISTKDAVSEGIERGFQAWWKNYRVESVPLASPEASFASLWDSLHDDDGTRWRDNPWVMAVTFNVIPQNIDRLTQ